MNLLVFGGNGFIGRRVCARAAAAGHEVTSVARSGPPPEGATPRPPVRWLSADVFAPDTYREPLADADCIVHSIGTISEAPTEGVTFERLNGDSAIVAALEADRAGVDRFVYISSSATPPFVDGRYLAARRRAERAIDGLDPATIVPRFGPVYGPGQPHFPGIVNRLFAAIGAIEPLRRRLGADRPFDVGTAAAAVTELATMADPPTGVVDAPRLASLGTGR